jgi:DNA-binding NarL/FixJ family response regulator
MSASIRLLLVDDQALFREGLRTILEARPGFEVVAEAANGREAISAAASARPDVVLMDLHMPVLDGVAATRELRATRPGTRILVLTTFDEDEQIFAALRAGAAGYLLKDCDSAHLAEAIEAVHRGDSFLQPVIAARVIAEFTRRGPAPGNSPPPLLEPLSERETDVLRTLAHGASNKEIAAALGLAEGTVKNHVSNILGKLGVLDRTQAALRARDLGIL